jgi:hypothetical protein
MSENRPKSNDRRPPFGLSLVLLIVLQSVTPAWAWGRLGHRLAERHLTPKGEAAIAALLEPGESLADASTWADEHKREIRGCAPWHNVAGPLDEPRYDARFSDWTRGRVASWTRSTSSWRSFLTRPGQSRNTA